MPTCQRPEAGFAEKFPEAAELVAQIWLDDEQYGSLEDHVDNEYGEGEEADAVDAWLEECGASSTGSSATD